jgi:hypothetical protein
MSFVAIPTYNNFQMPTDMQSRTGTIPGGLSKYHAYTPGSHSRRAPASLTSHGRRSRANESEISRISSIRFLRRFFHAQYRVTATRIGFQGFVTSSLLLLTLIPLFKQVRLVGFGAFGSVEFEAEVVAGLFCDFSATFGSAQKAYLQ